MPAISIVLAMSSQAAIDLARANLGNLHPDVTLAAVVSTAPELLAALERTPNATVVADSDAALQFLPVWTVLHRTGAGHRLFVITANDHDVRLAPLRSLGATLLADSAPFAHIAGGPPAPQAQAPTPPAAAPRPNAAPPPGVRTGTKAIRLITCYSPKGGSGTTTLAQSMALALAKQGHGTLLVDFALYGATAATLRLKQASGGLALVVSAIERDESLRTKPDLAAVLSRATQTYNFPGGALDVLLAAPPAKMERIRLEDAEAVLAVLRNTYQYVVVDASLELSERNMAALLQADSVVVSASPDVAAGWALYQLKGVFEALQIAPDRVGIVINRARPDLKLALEELSDASGFRRLGEIPDHYVDIQRAANSGIPPVLRVKPLETAVAGILKNLFPGLSPEGRRKGWPWTG